MIRKKTVAAFVFGIFVAVGSTVLMADLRSTTESGEAALQIDQVYVRTELPHWTEQHLESLAAESDVQQSIYLSAIQLVRMEREQGDALKAIPTLEQLAQRCPTQPLRNAIRRLIVDLHLEVGEYKAAEAQLNTIIDESLNQLN